MLCTTFKTPSSAGDIADTTWRYEPDGAGHLAVVKRGSVTLARLTYTGARLTKYQNANDVAAGIAHAIVIGYDNAVPAKVTAVGDGPISNVTGAAGACGASIPACWTFSYSPGPVQTDGSAVHGPGREADGSTTITPPKRQGLGPADRVYYDRLGRVVEQQNLILGTHTLTGYTDHDQVLWSEDEAGNPTDYEWDLTNDVLVSVTGPDSGSGRPVTRHRYDEIDIGDSSAAGAPLEGLAAAYYDNPNLAGQPSARETDPTITFYWGDGSIQPLPYGIVRENMSVRWTGNLVLDREGDYSFAPYTSGRARLFIDGSLVVDMWGSESGEPRDVWSPDFRLSRGAHRFELDYSCCADPAAAASAQLFMHWSCACGEGSFSYRPVSTHDFRPAYMNKTSTVTPIGRVKFRHFADPQRGLPDFDWVKNGDEDLFTVYTYDAFGRLTSKLMPKGVGPQPYNGGPGYVADAGQFGHLYFGRDNRYETDYSYYDPGERSASAPACGAASVAVDQAGQLARTAPYGLVGTTYVYDNAGRPIAKTRNAGTTCFTYDPASGLLATAKAPGDAVATTFTYDPAGNLLSVSDGQGSGHVVSTSYDERGEIVKTIDSLGAQASYAYDADGLVTQRDAKAAANGVVYSTKYRYDPAGAPRSHHRSRPANVRLHLRQPRQPDRRAVPEQHLQPRADQRQRLGDCHLQPPRLAPDRLGYRLSPRRREPDRRLLVRL